MNQLLDVLAGLTGLSGQVVTSAQLRDDGQAPDDAPGDGLFGALLSVPSPGQYQITIHMQDLYYNTEDTRSGFVHFAPAAEAGFAAEAEPTLAPATAPAATDPAERSLAAPAAPGTSEGSPSPAATNPAERSPESSAATGTRPIIIIPPTPARSPVPTGLNEAVPENLVAVEWPTEMRVGTSALVRLVFYPGADATPQPVPLAPERDILVTAPATEDVAANIPLVHAYPAFNAYLSASLKASSFEKDPEGHDPIPLDPGKDVVQWHWQITPRYGGNQEFTVSVSAHWGPDSSDVRIDREIWQETFQVKCKEPLLELGQINLISMVGAVVGASLASPWIYERIRPEKGRGKKQKAGES